MSTPTDDNTMFPEEDAHPLKDFLDRHGEYLDRLRRTGRPQVLTVDADTRLIVQDARAYQALLEKADAFDAEQTLRERLASVDAGEPGVPAEQVLAEVRQRLGIERG